MGVGTLPEERGAARAVTREANGPVRRMPRFVLLKSGRIRTGDGFVGCMRRNVQTGGSGVLFLFVLCIYRVVTVTVTLTSRSSEWTG